MPIALSPERQRTGITKLTGGRLVKGNQLVEEDLWISSVTGKILHSQAVFYGHQVVPDEVVDLKGKILAPGFIDVQFNGAFGFDFSTIPEDMATYRKGLKRLDKHLVHTGVTSYLPTIPSQRPEVYHKALHYLGPSGSSRNPWAGSESLGAHCEGPFISPTKNGIHSPEVLQAAPNGFTDLQACYGVDNLPPADSDAQSPIRMITAAPEVAGIAALIPEVARRGIVFSVGHTESTYEQTTEAVQNGATMITHLFNAMRPLHHRNPGPFGVLGQTGGTPRPYFGVISDGIHLHPTTVKIAWNAHPDGLILVTDAMKTVGLPDGIYDWTNGDRFVKKGSLLTLEGTDKIAGSSASLIECVSNFWSWTHAPIPEVIRAVTATPAEMLGIQHIKGTLDPDADADLLVLNAEHFEDGRREFTVDQVWKFGTIVYDAEAESFEV